MEGGNHHHAGVYSFHQTGIDAVTSSDLRLFRCQRHRARFVDRLRSLVWPCRKTCSTHRGVSSKTEDGMDYLFALFLVLLVAVTWCCSRGCCCGGTPPVARSAARRAPCALDVGERPCGDRQRIPVAQKTPACRKARCSPVCFCNCRRCMLDRLLEQSGSSWSVGRFLGWTVLAWAGGFLLARLCRLCRSSLRRPAPRRRCRPARSARDKHCAASRSCCRRHWI